ncbi:hypothetical protein [Rhodobacter sp. CZR27]|uniref:hypothetical protein n=1 Tax=Rhodobacter sp. CZR27 TaxID=2033869 RepID=UPI000BBEC2B9|nr:hypothetical protein [Rhodobacter sp. CZR27]
MPNLFAYLALLAWPLVVFVMFRRLSLPTALVWSILGGYLFLPSLPVFDLPALPAVDKTLIPSLSAAVMCLAVSRRERLLQRTGQRRKADRRDRQPAPLGYTGDGGRLPPRLRPARRSVPQEQAAPRQAEEGMDQPGGQGIINLLIAAALVTPFLTALTNPEPVLAGGRLIPSIRLYDAVSMVSGVLVTLLPFLLARRYLSTPAAREKLLRAFVAGGLAYSALILIEVRLSPQLNTWIYGYFPHSFLQHIRAGGFRPIVFLPHGLWVGIFMAMTVLAALTLSRLAGTSRERRRWLLTALWLVIVLVLSKTLGALAITLLLAPVALLLGPRKQMMVAAALGAVLLLYPMLRGAGWIPVQQISGWAAAIDAERAQSLNFRLQNEDMLLERANLKPVFGWGGWGRSRVYDPATGEDLSVTDGAWIIVAGTTGWAGYLALFGLLVIPALRQAIGRNRGHATFAASGAAMMLAANYVDLLPNATLTPITWMLAGALAGGYASARQPHQAEIQGLPGRTRTSGF